MTYQADRPFTLPHDAYDVVLFLGILYHLRNPFYVLEELARRTTHLLLSTRIARRYRNAEGDVGTELNCGHELKIGSVRLSGNRRYPGR